MKLPTLNGRSAFAPVESASGRKSRALPFPSVLWIWLDQSCDLLSTDGSIIQEGD